MDFFLPDVDLIVALLIVFVRAKEKLSQINLLQVDPICFKIKGRVRNMYALFWWKYFPISKSSPLLFSRIWLGMCKYPVTIILGTLVGFPQIPSTPWAEDNWIMVIRGHIKVEADHTLPSSPDIALRFTISPLKARQTRPVLNKSPPYVYKIIAFRHSQWSPIPLLPAAAAWWQLQ